MYIDGVKVNNHSLYRKDNFRQVLVYECINLDNREHYFEYKFTGENITAFDAVDIDENGVLKPYNEDIESISLDKSSMSLTVGDSKELTATTTPADSQIEWSSSDPSIATVDENGNIKGIAVGTATITAKIKVTDTIATCEVTVTAEDVPTDPEEPSGDGTLFIELEDGNIKQYAVTEKKIADFIKWYKNRDNDDSESPIYKFTKGDYKDYVVHDKIVWFEIR